MPGPCTAMELGKTRTGRRTDAMIVLGSQETVASFAKMRKVTAVPLKTPPVAMV